MRMRIGVLALGVALGVAGLSSGAGASTQQVAIPGAASSGAAIAQYLVSVGVDPSGVVIQRGAHNYAGPKCPGRGWTCTAAKRVLQIATDSGGNGDNEGDNRFQCTASAVFGSSSSPPNDCTIVQVSPPGGDNDARCVESSNMPTGVLQSCVIFQTNVNGDNHVEIRQQVDAHGGAVQDATQYAGVDQQNVSGSNDAEIKQQLNQETHDTTTAGLQSQNGHQGVSLRQRTVTGDNDADVKQSLGLNAVINGTTTGPISQSQDTVVANPTTCGFSASVCPNTSAGITQHSTSGGRNDARLNQSNDLNARAPKNATGTQTQGSQANGFLGHFDQFSTGISTVNGNQQEHQNLRVGGEGGNDNQEGDNNNQQGGNNQSSLGATAGLVRQSQYGPAYFGSEQRGNLADRYNIDQNSSQRAARNAFQNDQEYANCDTDGICKATQHINQNGNNQRNSCSMSSCHIGLTVTSGGEGGTTRCTGESCRTPPPPPPPPPPIIGCIDC